MSSCSEWCCSELLVVVVVVECLAAVSAVTDAAVSDVAVSC
jgi:hypothetical protein